MDHAVSGQALKSAKSYTVTKAQAEQTTQQVVTTFKSFW